MNHYVTPQIAQQTLGISAHALKNWDAQGFIKTIKTPGGKRLYDLSTFISSQTKQDSNSNQKSCQQQVCYCRVSTRGQKDDLNHQIDDMREQFPDANIITDIGSGINFKRKGLRTILGLSCKGLISEVVVAYRDRLCRFAFELIEWILQLHGVKLVVLHPAMEYESNVFRQSEMVEDILAIINVFNCRINGQRRYHSTPKTKNQQVEKVQQTGGQSDSSDSIVSQPGNQTKTQIVVRLRSENL